jgi:hypothetical protein
MYFPKNLNVKSYGLNSCKKCHYYFEQSYFGCDMIQNSGLCSKFYLKNKITNEYKYLTIEEARKYEEFCGKNAKRFVKKELK